MKKAIVITIVACIAAAVSYSFAKARSKNSELDEKYNRLIKDVVAADECEVE